MKTLIRSCIVILLLSLAVASCNKDKTNTDDATTTAEITTHSDDQARFENEQEAVANDGYITMEATAGFARGEQVQSLICDATVVVDTISSTRTITITYNGTNCLGNRTRTGVVILSMAQGVRWRNAGAVVNVTVQNLKVTRLSDNKSITISGTQTYTNVSGGLMANLATLGSITHTITSSNMSVTFDNGTQRTWQVALKRLFTYSTTGVVITITGTHTEGTVANVVEWGLNRFGNAFTTAISQALVVKQDCNFRVTSGQVTHITPAVTATATFGLDAGGNPTTCPGTGSYYYKLVWTGPVNSHTVILPY